MQIVVEGFLKRMGRYEPKDGKPAQVFVKIGGMDDVQLLVSELPVGVVEGDYVQAAAAGHVAYIASDKSVVFRCDTVKLNKKGGS